MYRLNDQQIDFIHSDLLRRGIRTESIRLNLLDHICILIEEHLHEKDDFYQYYTTVLPKFYKQELCELEEEARLLMTMRKGHLLLYRSQFFLLLFIVLIGPFITFDLVQIAHSTPIAGQIPSRVWAGPLIFALFPMLTLLVLFLTPERFDPLFPRRARVLLGSRPFIRILPVDFAS
ncbi:MAG: hypothetical protein J0H74_35745 [Chitinophagaceae bacterium]|nr:hypothetical protein [Chitinophagaceae bacterium]